jgi:hypothetical protein
MRNQPMSKQGVAIYVALFVIGLLVLDVAGANRSVIAVLLLTGCAWLLFQALRR